MGKLTSFRKRGEEVTLLGQHYNFMLTNYGYEYLAEIFGAAKTAEKKLVELSLAASKAMETESKDDIPAEYFDVILHFVRAGIEHNKYDATGKVVLTLPTFFDLKMNYSRKEIFGMVMLLMRARAEAIGSEEKTDDPTIAQAAQ